MNARRGSVLVAVLWCVTLLAVFVLGILHTTKLDTTVVKNQGDAIQAYYLAVAGAEKAKALIYHEAAERKKAGRNHSGQLYDAPDQFREIQFGRGRFSVVRHAPNDEGGALIYGVSDEESRLNVNLAGPEELLKLEEMLPEHVAAILDWRDRDENVSENGAEAEYYSALRPPYLPRNDRIQTMGEMLSIRGITPRLLFGEDQNGNGMLDAEEDDGDFSSPPDNQDGRLFGGWAESLSLDSQTRNENAIGESRVNVQEADEAELRTVRGITPELARAIIAYRDQNRLESLPDVLNVAAIIPTPNPAAAAQAQGQPNPAQPPGAPIQPPRGQATGPRLISEELFLEIADDITTSSEIAQRGAVNVNTASFSVLRCLPGMTDELARAIINYRSSAGFLPNIAHLLRVDGFDREVLKRVAPRITVRSETFRIISEGVMTSTRARKRIEIIVTLGRGTIDTISYRELL